MAYKLDEKNVVNGNVELRFGRDKFNGIRYQDNTTPVYTTYYHLDTAATTTDAGFKDVAAIIGSRSPIKFNKIEDFPLYNIDQIVLQLQDEDQGLDTDYEGEAVILASTIKPVQNDYFMIPVLKDPYLFRVTSIQYDTIMPDNYYRIGFKLDYIDAEKVEQLNQQIKAHNGEFVVVQENIGTENACIIEKGNFAKISQIENMLSTMRQSYLALFYSDRYNVFLGPLDQAGLRLLYDPYQTEFINKHKLFLEKNSFKTIVLTEQTEDKQKLLKYEKSVYRFMEIPDETRMNQFEFVFSAGVTHKESGFYRWRDRQVEVLDIIEHWPIKTMHVFDADFVDKVKKNEDTGSDVGELIKKHIRRIPIHIEDIPMDLNDELLHLNNSLEIFILTPLLFYIIQKVLKDELHTQQLIW